MRFEQWVRDILIGCIIDEHIDKFKQIKVHKAFLTSSNGIDYNNISLEYHDLIAILQYMPDYYRIIYNLRVIELYTSAQVADLLSIPGETGEYLLTEARNHIIAVITRLQPIQVVNQRSTC